MKVGDKFPVTIAGHEVGVAVVRAVNRDNTVELQFEGRRVVMATRTEIDTAPVANSTQHEILGVEQRQENNVDPEPAEQSTPPVVTPENPQPVEQAQPVEQPAPVEPPAPVEEKDVPNS